MNVTCPECATVFRVDPAKVPAGGVRARCSVCRAVFPVGLAEAAGAAPVAAVAPPVSAAPVFVERAVPPPGAVLRWCRSLRRSHAPPPAGPAPPARPVFAAPTAPPSARPAPPATPPRPSLPAVALPPIAAPPPRPAAPPAAPAAAAPRLPAVAPAAAPSPPAPPPAPRPSGGPSGVTTRVINPFLQKDPVTKAQRLARALVSDMVSYHPAKRAQGLKEGTLKEIFREEVKKSYEEYVLQIGEPLAASTTFFQDALNEILAGGQRIF